KWRNLRKIKWQSVVSPLFAPAFNECFELVRIANIFLKEDVRFALVPQEPFNRIWRQRSNHTFKKLSRVTLYFLSFKICLVLKCHVRTPRFNAATAHSSRNHTYGDI